jgi:hypothetical protein
MTSIHGSVADPDPYVLELLDPPDPDPLVRGMDPDPDPSTTKQKNSNKNLDSYCFVTSFLLLIFEK